MKNKCLIKIFLISLLVLTINLAVYAANNSKEPNILVQAHFIENYENRIKLKMYNEFTADYLNEHGLNAVIIDNDSEIDELLSSAAWFGAFFLVEIIVDAEIKADSLLFKAYSTWDGKTIKEAGAGVSSSEEYDVKLLPALEQLVDVINQYLLKTEVQTMIAEYEAAAELSEEIPVEESDTKTETEIDADIESKDFTKPVTDSDYKSQEADLYAEPEKLTEVKKGLLKAVVSSGAFISTFRTADYFDIGLNIGVSVNYIFTPIDFNLTLGSLFDFTFFDAAGVNEQTTNLIGSLGIISTLIPASNLYLKPLITGSCGLSYFRVIDEDDKLYTAFVPYLSGGIGVLYDINDIISLAFNIEARVYIEKTIALTGFLPSLALDLTL